MRLRFLGLMLLGAAPLAAQQRERSGFWWGFGIGYGSYHHTCDDCDRPSGTTGVSSGYLAVGGNPTRQLTLGIELASGYMKQGAGVRSASLIGTWYSRARGGPFVRCGVGRSTYRQDSYAEFPPFKGTGMGWLAALGWDVRADRGPSFTPMVTFRAGTPGTVAAPANIVARNLRQRSVAFTLGLTFP